MLQLLLIVAVIAGAGYVVGCGVEDSLAGRGLGGIHGLWFFQWKRWHWSWGETRWTLGFTLLAGWPLLLCLLAR